MRRDLVNFLWGILFFLDFSPRVRVWPIKQGLPTPAKSNSKALFSSSKVPVELSNPLLHSSALNRKAILHKLKLISLCLKYCSFVDTKSKEVPLIYETIYIIYRWYKTLGYWSSFIDIMNSQLIKLIFSMVCIIDYTIYT